MKKILPKLFRFPFLLTALLLTVSMTGCGYRVGSLSHPQIKTVGIADVKNESYEVLASALLRDVLAERFQFDNSLKLAPVEKADCIVYTRILNVENGSIRLRNTSRLESYRPNEFQLLVRVEYVVLMPGKAQPLVPKGIATGSCVYQYTHDPAIGRANALKQCMLRVSNSIVAATTEAW